MSFFFTHHPVPCGVLVVACALLWTKCFNVNEKQLISQGNNVTKYVFSPPLIVLETATNEQDETLELYQKM
jgi:hypothetical protein